MLKTAPIMENPVPYGGLITDLPPAAFELVTEGLERAVAATVRTSALCFSSAPRAEDSRCSASMA